MRRLKDLHRMFNAGDFGGIYDNASVEMRNFEPRDKFVDGFVMLEKMCCNEDIQLQGVEFRQDGNQRNLHHPGLQDELFDVCHE